MTKMQLKTTAGVLYAAIATYCMSANHHVTASSSPSSFSSSFGHDDHSFAISHDNFLPSSRTAFARRHRPVSEARLWLDRDDDVNNSNNNNSEENEDLMDTTIYSSSTTSTQGNSKSSPNLHHRANGFPSSQIQLPLSLQEDPLDLNHPQNNHNAIWTEQSLQQFEHRLRQSFGKTSFQPQLLKTGTTIAGVCGYDTVTRRPFCVLGADTRATAGRMVADKECQKIHCLARNLWCCGAGTSADLDQITRQCRYTLALKSLVEHDSIGNSHSRRREWRAQDEPDRTSHLESTALHAASMATACRYLRNTLYEAGGSMGANLIVGGVDEGTGIPHIRAIHPHGSMDPLPYAALGSGGLAAMAVIESRFHSNITLEEGIQMVKEAIFSGIQNDMGSGSQVDLCIITTTTSTATPFSGNNDEPVEKLRVVSNYTRAVVPEQQLAAPEQPIKVSLPQDSTMSTPGVNGFGSHPFAIRSRNLILPSRTKDERDQMQQWNQLLGYQEEVTV